MKAIDKELVYEVIKLAEALQSERREKEPEGTQKAGEDILAHLVNSPTKQALVDFIDGLPLAQRIELQALMYLGRDKLAPDRMTFAEYCDQLKENPDYAGSQMAGKTPLVQYLRDGLKLCKP